MNPMDCKDMQTMWGIMDGLRQTTEAIKIEDASQTMPLAEAEKILQQSAQKIADTVSKKWKGIATDQVPEVVTGARTTSVDMIPIFIANDGKILSIPQFSKDQRRYIYPGGKASIGETAGQSVLREAEEELKLTDCLTNKMIDHSGYLTLMHVQSHPKHDTRGLCSIPFVKFIVVDDQRKKEFLNLHENAVLEGWFEPSDDFKGKVPYHFSYQSFCQLVETEKEEKLIGHMRFRQTLSGYLKDITKNEKIDIKKIQAQNIADVTAKIYTVSHPEVNIFTLADLKKLSESRKIKEHIPVSKELVDKISHAFNETQLKLETCQLTREDKIKWDDVRWWLLGAGEHNKTWSGLRSIIEYPILKKLSIDKHFCLISTEAAPLYACYQYNDAIIKLPVPRHMSVEEAVASSFYEKDDEPGSLRVSVVKVSSHEQGFTAECKVQKSS